MSTALVITDILRQLFVKLFDISLRFLRSINIRIPKNTTIAIKIGKNAYLIKLVAKQIINKSERSCELILLLLRIEVAMRAEYRNTRATAGTKTLS